jgi:glutamine cyclotransferase
MRSAGRILLYCFFITSFSGSNSYSGTITTTTIETKTPVYTVEVVRTLPHDKKVFTQGLVYMDGHLFEGTGLYGKSALHRLNIETGLIEQKIDLADRYFGEGISIYNDKIIQLTWKAGIGFVYDKTSFSLLHTFEYPGDGWGITRNKTHLIMSNGTNTLSFLDPQTYSVSHTIQVSDRGTNIYYLNELEYINGEIFANVWPRDWVVRINPKNGKVTGWISLEGVLADKERDKNLQVFNGIAYDKIRDRTFLTVKNWPLIYEKKIIPAN